MPPWVDTAAGCRRKAKVEKREKRWTTGVCRLITLGFGSDYDGGLYEFLTSY